MAFLLLCRDTGVVWPRAVLPLGFRRLMRDPSIRVCSDICRTQEVAAVLLSWTVPMLAILAFWPVLWMSCYLLTSWSFCRQHLQLLDAPASVPSTQLVIRPVKNRAIVLSGYVQHQYLVTLLEDSLLQSSWYSLYNMKSAQYTCRSLSLYQSWRIIPGVWILYSSSGHLHFQVAPGNPFLRPLSLVLTS